MKIKISVVVTLLVIAGSGGYGWADVGFYTNEAEWVAAVTGVETLGTTPEDVAKANEVLAPPTTHQYLGRILTFDKAKTGLSWSFTIETLQDNAQFIFSDHSQNPAFADKLSVGNVGEHEDDDWQLQIIEGPSLYACAVDLVENEGTEPNEFLEVLDKDRNLIGRLPIVDFPLFGFLGVVSDTPIGFLRFIEDPGDDDSCLTNFRFGMLLLLLSPNGGESWVAGTTKNIEWETAVDANIAEVKIEYSDSNGQSWNLIDANTTNDGEYDWLVPEVTSPSCLVRVSDANDPNIYDVSDDVFTIFQCLGPVPGDLNKDCYTNWKDVAILAAHWLHCANPLDPACGIVAYWSFDEGSGTIAHDSAGDNDGNLVGDPNWVDGISGKALSFDGSGDYVSVPSSNDLSFNAPSEAFSASFWIKPDTVIPIEQTILENEDDYIVELREGGGLAYLKTDSGNLYHNCWHSYPEISVGNWAHVVITYDGTGSGGTKMYVNGEEKPVTNTSYHGGGSASGDDFAIGIRAFDFASEPYGGEIDEVLIYNRALTATEVQYLYENQ